MDVFESGLNQGNLLVTGILVAVLLFLSAKAKMLDRQGANAAALLGVVVGGLGHWTWLLILLGFLVSSHKATKCCLLYTSPSPRDRQKSRMPSSA